ncbi:MAG: DUF3993 domain-containing protein [Heyndrickxia sp.]
MVRKFFVFTVLIVVTLFGLNSNVMAKAKHVDYKQLVKDAFHTQVALSEKERSLHEIKGMLKHYFTNDFITLFLNENLVKTDKGYQTFGTDFPLYYIPFFSYGNTTKVKKVGNRIYIYENMSKKEEGPVTYNNDFQGVRLKKVDGSWKIDEVVYFVPQSIIQPAKSKEQNKSILHNKNSLKAYIKNIFFNPLTFFTLPTNIQPIWQFISKF